ERIADRLGVVRRDDEPADALLGGSLDEAHLRGGARLGRADLGVGAAELVDGLFAARVRRVEVRVAEVLRQEGDGEVGAIAAPPPRPSAAARGTPGDGERDAHGERREADTQGAPLAIKTEHRCFLSWGP